MVHIMLAKWVIIDNKILESKVFLPLITYHDMKCYRIWIFALLFSPSLCWWLLMHGSFAVMSSNYKFRNSWMGYIISATMSLLLILLSEVYCFDIKLTCAYCRDLDNWEDIKTFYSEGFTAGVISVNLGHFRWAFQPSVIAG